MRVLPACLPLLAACTSPPPPPIEHPMVGREVYTRVALRGSKPDGGERVVVHATPFLGDAKIYPAGTAARLELCDARGLWLTLDSDACVLRPVDRDAPTDRASLDRMFDKLFTAEPPTDTPEFGRMPQPGATKDEVLRLLGYPYLVDGVRPTDTLDRAAVLASDEWIYRSRDLVVTATERRYAFEDGILVEVR